MLRTGIFKISQLKNKQLKDLFGKEKNISIKLYHDIKTDSSIVNTIYNKYSEIILNRFNTKSNAIKRTYRNRFNAFDVNCIKKIEEASFENVKIHDLAISDGRASCFFLENAINSFQKLNYTGSDIAMYYYLYSKPNEKNCYVITQENGVIIEITQAPFVWNMARKEGKLYFINNWLKSYYLKKCTNLLKSGALNAPEKIHITDKEFSQLIQSNSNFSLKNYNLFEADTATYNVIRVMNILHFGYFSEDQLQLIFNNIYNSLEENGLLIEGSNEDAGSEVEGAIYKKTKNGFVLMLSGEKKSRIEKSVLNFKP
ncbi:MAG: hypothetical protein Q7W45_14375 [Bacteroidota bacterium]|nr:hypothetical protein [Bacteroidota bacterium]MDP3144344.1 hypothetical protein [Bacteroidota bacterium]